LAKSVETGAVQKPVINKNRDEAGSAVTYRKPNQHLSFTSGSSSRL
jgi:hypothetical protein